MPLFDDESLDAAIAKESIIYPNRRRLQGLTPDKFSPEMIATIGGLVDAASTYNMLKRGTRQETNPMYGGIRSPLGTSLGVLGTSLGMKGARHLIRKKYPKFADILAGHQGAEQLGIGSLNFSDDMRPSDVAYRDTLYRRR